MRIETEGRGAAGRLVRGAGGSAGAVASTALLGLMTLLAGSAWGQAETRPGATGAVLILTATDTFEVAVEIADTPEARGVGLMDRDDLPPDAGMIFIFEGDRPANAGFYMYRTRIPLDIAFADAAGSIVAILTMEPCTRSQWFCPGYPPGAPYRMALEVNAGFFAARGIEVGDRLTLLRDDPAPAAH